MSNIKHLVTSGCSFTHDTPTWANYLSELSNKNLHNVSMSGAGNHLISTFLIQKIEELLKNDTDEKEIFAIIQWSGLFRFDKIIKKESDFAKERPVHVANKVKERSFEPPKETDNTWVMCAGSRNIGIWPTIYSFITKEQAFVETLENILRVQWYLKSKNIKYKMFTGWDIFTDGIPKKEFIDHSLDAESNSMNQFSLNNNYFNINNSLLKDNCKWFGYLFDLIDWNNFWVYNSERIKYGGLTQWAADNVPNELRFRALNDAHPSSITHKSFAENVLKEFLQ